MNLVTPFIWFLEETKKKTLEISEHLKLLSCNFVLVAEFIHCCFSLAYSITFSHNHINILFSLWTWNAIKTVGNSTSGFLYLHFQCSQFSDNLFISDIHIYIFSFVYFCSFSFDPCSIIESFTFHNMQ